MKCNQEHFLFFQHAVTTLESTARSILHLIITQQHEVPMLTTEVLLQTSLLNSAGCNDNNNHTRRSTWGKYVYV